MFDYESPITQIVSDMQMEYENGVVRAVQNVGFHVNKEELAKALAYDRGQYDKGYEDGLDADKWTPCEKEYPEEGIMVLVYDSLHDVIDIAEYLCPHWYARWGKMDEEITAWQPLPLPYRVLERSEDDE